MAEKIEFADYEERIISQIHGVKGDGIGLRAKIEHRLILPKKAPNTQQMIVVFYCNHDILISFRKIAEKVFGDSDFTKSVARFFRAGEHYMDGSVDIALTQQCVARQQEVERNIKRMQEEYAPLTKDFEELQDKVNESRSELRGSLNALEITEQKLTKCYAIEMILSKEIEDLEEERDLLLHSVWTIPTLAKEICLRLISKLGLKRTSQK